MLSEKKAINSLKPWWDMAFHYSLLALISLGKGSRKKVLFFSVENLGKHVFRVIFFLDSVHYTF